METKNLIIVVVVAVVAIVIGGATGMMIQQQKNAPQIAQAESLMPAIKGLSSKVIPSIIAYGQVTSIEGRNISLSYNGEALTIPVKENANVYSFIQADGAKAGTAPAQQKVLFSDIKKGDSVNVSVKLFQDGRLEGQSVIILMKAK